MFVHTTLTVKGWYCCRSGGLWLTDWLSLKRSCPVFDQVSVASWRLAPMSVRTCWCRILPMTSPWPSPELLLSSAWSRRTPSYTSVAGEMHWKMGLDSTEAGGAGVYIHLSVHWLYWWRVQGHIMLELIPADVGRGSPWVVASVSQDRSTI